jgi:hypothetical protein
MRWGAREVVNPDWPPGSDVSVLPDQKVENNNLNLRQMTLGKMAMPDNSRLLSFLKLAPEIKFADRWIGIDRDVNDVNCISKRVMLAGSS